MFAPDISQNISKGIHMVTPLEVIAANVRKSAYIHSKNIHMIHQKGQTNYPYVLQYK